MPKKIKYVWKCRKPRDPYVAQALMDAAYQTAIETNPNACEILVRKDVHASTTKAGAQYPDPPHITIAAKDAKQAQNGTHEASHGYTHGPGSRVIHYVSPSGYVKRDDTLDSYGREIWPQGLPEEEVEYASE